jgi:hypothetical protein
VIYGAQGHEFDANSNVSITSQELFFTPSKRAKRLLGGKFMSNLTETAKYLASKAIHGEKLYYSDMAEELGLGSAQNCTSPLQEVMRWCHKTGNPDLSVIVVAKDDKLPSWHSDNLKWDDAQVENEQIKVFAFSWADIFKSLAA